MTLLFLDIRLGKINKEINGIDLAKKITIEAPFCQIIFLTGYVDFAPYVYEADHLYFVLKTQLDTMMPKALEKAARKICRPCWELILSAAMEAILLT